MDSKEYIKIFDRAFLKAISDWQQGWNEDQDKRRELADKLVKACKNLPTEFKISKGACFRKRFIVGGEIVPILIDDDFFEGIASWTLDINCAKVFKKLLKRDTKFAMIFKHQPKKDEIIVNICELWKNEFFKKAVDDLNKEEPELAYPLLNFQDFQSEVILRTTLKGSEIEHIVGISSDFDKICDMGNILQEEREELSKRYAKDPNGIPITFPTYASMKATKAGVAKTVSDMKKRISDAKLNGFTVDNLVFDPHKEDLKYKVPFWYKLIYFWCQQRVPKGYGLTIPFIVGSIEHMTVSKLLVEIKESDFDEKIILRVCEDLNEYVLSIDEREHPIANYLTGEGALLYNDKKIESLGSFDEVLTFLENTYGKMITDKTYSKNMQSGEWGKYTSSELSTIANVRSL